MPGRGAESRGRGVGGTSWRRWFPSWALEDWEGFGQKEKVGEKFQAEGRASTKAKWRATWGGRGRERDGKAEGVRGSGAHSHHFLPQTPTKLQPSPPGPLPGSISCWLPRLCWPQPPTGPSPTRACTLEPQAPSESQGPDRHHTPCPISRLTGIGGPPLPSWTGAPLPHCSAPGVWPGPTVMVGSCGQSPLTLEAPLFSLNSAETSSPHKESRAGGSQRGKLPAQSSSKAGNGVRLGTRAPTSQPAPFCLGSDSSKPCFTSLFPATLNCLEWVVSCTSVLGGQGGGPQECPHPRVWAADIAKLCPVLLASLGAQNDGKGGDTC